MKRRLVLIAAIVLTWLGGMGLANTVRFAVVGDTQGDPVNTGTYPQVIQAVLDMKPSVNFVIAVGDLVWGTDDGVNAMKQQFEFWREVSKPWLESDMFGEKIYVVPGNHDIHNNQAYAKLWQEVFSNMPDNGPKDEKHLSYSFDVGPCHFLIVNTEWPKAAQIADLDWVKNDLTSTDKPVVLAFGHRPAFPFYRHKDNSLNAHQESRDALWQLFVDHNVRAYFCGHEHKYDHFIHNNVHQITTGGLPGNFSLSHNFLIVDADENNVTVSVYSCRGRLLDQYSLFDTTIAADTHTHDTKIMLTLLTPYVAVVLPPVVLAVILIRHRRKRRTQESSKGL